MNAKPSFSGEVRQMLRKFSVVPITLTVIQAVLILLCVYYFGVHRGSVQRRDYASGQMSQIVETYDRYIRQCRDDPALLELLQGQSSPETVASMYDFLNSQTVRANFYILDAQGQAVLGSVLDLTGYLQAKPPYTSGIFYRMGQHPDQVILMLNNAGSERRRSMVLSIGSAIRQGDATVGYLIFELDPGELLEAISTPGMGDLVVTNEYGTALLTSKNSYLDSYNKLLRQLQREQGVVRLDGALIFVTGCQVPESRLQVYALLELNPFYQALILSAVLGLALLVIMMAANYLLVRKMAAAEAGSIDRLINDLDRMQREGIYVSLPPAPKGSFTTLEETYRQLLENTRRLVEANRQEAVMRTTAEIKQLESQVNPHFIFNTLEVIRCLIRLDPTAANRMILDFSDLLRYSIDNTRQTVPLEDDLRYIHSYLSIMQMRANHPLEYEIQADPGTEHCLLPKLCMQPIVENAVKYAADVPQPLHLTIGIRLREPDLVLTVQDNGPGIPPERLAEIRQVLEEPQHSGKFFGLYNVHRRLRLMYGSSYGLQLESAPGLGTTVTVRIPAVKEGMQ